LARQVEATMAPRSGKKVLSQRWYANLAVSLVGYDRSANIYLAFGKYRTRLGALRRASREALSRRRDHITALKATLPLDGPKPVADQESVAAPALLRDLTELKIGVFIPQFMDGKGGAEKVAGKLADLLARSKASVNLVCRPPANASPSYPLDPRVRIHHLIEKDDQQVAKLRGERFDLLVCFGMPHFYSRVAHISRLLDVPFVVQECTNPRNLAFGLKDAHVCRSDEEAFWLRQAVLAHAAAVRFTVPAYAEQVVRDVKPFTYAFYNALVSPGARRDSGDLSKKIVCVSALKNDNKNGMAAVNAFCRFTSRREGWSLHLYGPNNYRRELAMVTRRFPEAAVIDHGIVHDVDEIYGDAYALIIPSFEEGLPNVVVEALSYGVPCIGFSDCSGVKQIISHEETGLLVDREDPESLDAALARLADPDFRRDLSINAARFAKEQFRPEAWEANWLRLLHNAANQLNNESRPQFPVARNSGDPRAARWSHLLDTYLHFDE